MENKMQDTILTIVLWERIDSGSAAEAESEIMGLIEAQNPAGVVLDAKEMQYISSAGLRIVLKVKKKVADMKIVNVSTEVFEIFRMTGFCDMIDIRKAMREVSVEGCDLIGAGAHGKVYRLDGDTIVKVYSKKEQLDEIEREIAYARSAFINGVPTAIPFDVVRCGDCYGAVFELINACTLAEALNDHPEKYEEYSAKYTQLIRTLHDTKGDTERLSNTKELYHERIDYMRKYLTKEEVELLHEIIASVPDRDTLVHGDIHPKNIMLQDGEPVLIDMAAITYGHPVFDYAGMVLSHVLSGAGGSNMTRRIIGIEYQTALRLWEDLIRADFGDRPEAEQHKIREILMGYGWVKYAVAPALNRNQDPEITEKVVRKAHKYFLPNAGKLIGSVYF